MIRALLRSLIRVMPLLAVGGCYLAAGLGDFVPADDDGDGGASDTKGKGSSATGKSATSGALPPGCDHVVITEIRSASDDFVELFNPSPDVVYLEGWQLDGIQADGDPQTKWVGMPSHSIPPGGYFVVAVESVTDRDANLTGFATPGIAVARLVKASGETVDAVCVCDQPGCMPAGFLGDCARALVVSGFSSAQSPLSAQRQGICLDTDDPAADFVGACPTPRADLAQAAPTCP